jgi:hypothetical protein
MSWREYSGTGHGDLGTVQLAEWKLWWQGTRRRQHHDAAPAAPADDGAAGEGRYVFSRPVFRTKQPVLEWRGTVARCEHTAATSNTNSH